MKQLAISGQLSAKTQRVMVMIVTEAPAIGKPEMLGGIRTREAAAEWGNRNGFETVYWFKSRERVYADKLTKRVDVLAEQLATKSNHLVQVAEAYDA